MLYAAVVVKEAVMGMGLRGEGLGVGVGGFRCMGGGRGVRLGWGGWGEGRVEWRGGGGEAG